jgi:hypothetical protein
MNRKGLLALDGPLVVFILARIAKNYVEIAFVTTVWDHCGTDHN